MASTNWTPSSPNSTNFGPQTSVAYDDSSRAYDTSTTGNTTDYYEGAVPTGPAGFSTNWSTA